MQRQVRQQAAGPDRAGIRSGKMGSLMHLDFSYPQTHTHTRRGSVVEWNSCRGEQMLPPFRFVANKTSQATPEAPTLPQPRVSLHGSLIKLIDQLPSTLGADAHFQVAPSFPVEDSDSDCSATPLNSIDKRK